jgi:carbonic anhydrase/acetyltransferase-like protein (isoleucine patch superfamily)
MSALRLDPALIQVDPSAYIAPGAVLVGDVSIGARSSVWFGCVLRADTDRIQIGAGSNIQDLTVIHGDAGDPTIIGDGVTVGHRVVLHGCRIGDGALIGMGAIILNNAEIGAQCLVGAGALVTMGKVFPPRTLILGSPAKAVRELTQAEIDDNAASAEHYRDAAIAYRDGAWARVERA